MACFCLYILRLPCCVDWLWRVNSKCACVVLWRSDLCEITLARVLLMIMGANIAVTMLSTPFDSYIVAHERFVFQQSRQLFTALAQPFLAVLLLWLGMGAVGVACAQLTISTILLVWNIAFATRKLSMRFTFHGLEWSLFKAVAIFSFWIFLNQIFDLVNNNVPNFLLAQWLVQRQSQCLLSLCRSETFSSPCRQLCRMCLPRKSTVLWRNRTIT
mgnify:CR=1 FL=1